MKKEIPDYLVAAESPFKKIVRFLRDKRFVYIRLSIKATDKSGKQKEFSIEGERPVESAAGWVIHAQPDPNLIAPKSPTVLQERFVEIEQAVRDYIATNALDAQWNELRGLIDVALEKVLNSGRSVDDFANGGGLTFIAASGTGYEAHFAAPILATAYAMVGSKALEDGDLNHAAHCSDQGLYWSRFEMLIPHPGARERYKERARKGGKRKALNYEPVKVKVAEMLKESAPDDRRDSWRKAIAKVAAELTDKHSEFVEDCGLECHALVDTIPVWIDKEPERFSCRIKLRA